MATGGCGIDTLSIVGVGLIGGSIGLAAKQRRLVRRTVGVGRRPSSLRRARRLGAVDSTTCRLDRGVADAELVIFCTPVDVVAEQAEAAALHCHDGTVLTDTGSTKRRIVHRLDDSLPPGRSFVGGHPLAGSEKRGVEHARPDLFQQAICVLTPTRHTEPKALQRTRRFWHALGSRVLIMSPERHDQALGYTSHLPHLAAACLSILLPAQFQPLASSGFCDTTRVAGSDPDLWTAIFLDNAEELLNCAAGYQAVMDQFRAALASRDAAALKRLWRQAQAKRQQTERRAGRRAGRRQRH